ncbi:RDD family protein [Pseudorhodobacter sp. MZDSW-24AT]|uniref:RDD family protein n=1 Tax=Pseudorhodobacter sp. MZDSW-24AT TaxID=2052957 RepID=UPI001E55E881|nr:RDD family protein [Pseudorhodobacter sp. MZDSW-24AT]
MRTVSPMMMSSMQPDPERHPAFYAGVLPKRFLAWVLDLILIGVVTALIVPFTAFTALFFLPFLFLVVGFLYRWLTLSGRSATWGMRLMSIEFLDRNGQRFDGATALLHTLGYTVSMAFVMPQVLSVVLMVLSSRGQGLSDMVLGSVAINSPSSR